MLTLALLAAVLGQTPPETHLVRGTILGCSGEHPIVVLLIGADYFEKQKPLRKLVIAASKVRDGKVAYEFRVQPGEYAVTAYEDENENGELDMGWFGPSEPAQFYRKFTAWRAPRFDDVRFVVAGDIKGADIVID